MKRIALGVLVAVALVAAAQLLFAPDAWAHGGQFRGPGDSVPPGLREPSDPTPPPPPPPTSAPPPVTPPTTTPTPKAPPAPTTPGVQPPPTTAPDNNNPQRGKLTPASFEDWTFWYHNNKSDLENLKWALYHRMSSDNPLFVSDRDSTGARGGQTRWTEKAVLEAVIPTLLWAMDEKNAGHQDTESAAYIALAKVARDPAQIPMIFEGLNKAAKHNQVVIESAALALGLLRRAEKEDQFTAKELDGVREKLFAVFEDSEYQVRTRGFAVVSIGLLGDQPTGSGDYANDTAAAQRATTEHLFELLKGNYPSEDLLVGVMLAIGLQPATSVLPEQREVLANCAYKGRLFRDQAQNLTRAYAAQALGRIGTKDDIRTLNNVMTAKRNVDQNTQRSAAIGLGLLGRLVSGEDRVEVAQTLLKSIDRIKDKSTKNFGIISLAYLLVEDIKAKTTDVIGNTKADEYLLETAAKGSYLHRSFGALALGLVVREISDELEVDAYQEFREKALTLLREGVASKRGDKKGRAAFCTAVGIARDSRSRDALREIVEDTAGDKMLRSYAALGIGLIGEPTAADAKAIAEAMRERSSEELRRQAAVALGLLGNPKIAGTNKDAVELLLEELKDARTQSHKGQVVLALASIGDHRAIEKLVDLVKDQNEQDLTRALACAGLGLIGDLEWIPSLSRASKNINYRASTDLVNELLSIL